MPFSKAAGHERSVGRSCDALRKVDENDKLEMVTGGHALLRTTEYMTRCRCASRSPPHHLARRCIDEGAHNSSFCCRLGYPL